MSQATIDLATRAVLDPRVSRDYRRGYQRGMDAARSGRRIEDLVREYCDNELEAQGRHDGYWEWNPGR